MSSAACGGHLYRCNAARFTAEEARRRQSIQRTIRPATVAATIRARAPADDSDPCPYANACEPVSAELASVHGNQNVDVVGGVTRAAEEADSYPAAGWVSAFDRVPGQAIAK